MYQQMQTSFPHQGRSTIKLRLCWSLSDICHIHFCLSGIFSSLRHETLRQPISLTTCDRLLFSPHILLCLTLHVFVVCCGRYRWLEVQGQLKGPPHHCFHSLWYDVSFPRHTQETTVYQHPSLQGHQTHSQSQQGLKVYMYTCKIQC